MILTHILTLQAPLAQPKPGVYETEERAVLNRDPCSREGKCCRLEELATQTLIKAKRNSPWFARCVIKFLFSCSSAAIANKPGVKVQQEMLLSQRD